MRSEENIKKQKKTIDRRKLEKKENEKQLLDLKNQLLKKEYQDNLEQYLKNKKEELAEKLNNTNSTLSIMEIKSLLSPPNYTGGSPIYTNTELSMLFDYYKRYIIQINKNLKEGIFLPTKTDFCNFIGISTITFNSWKRSDDSERRDLIQKIDDYIIDLNLSSAQAGKVKEITTIFRAKAEHGLVEAQAPIVVEHKTEANINEIMQQIKEINSGRSLKPIELEKKKDESWG